MNLPSNGHCECCTSWTWLPFSRSWILKCEYLENGESKQKLYDICSWYLPSNGTIANVVLHDLDLNFQSQKCETLIFQKRWEVSQKYVIWLLLRFMFVIEWHHCECCTSWPLLSFSRSNIFLLFICYKKMHRQWMSWADLPRLAWLQPWSCSCYINMMTEGVTVPPNISLSCRPRVPST